MSVATVTSKGQITVPKAVRDAIGLIAGDQVDFRVREDGVVEMVPATTELSSLFGAIKPAVRGVSVQDMNAAIRGRAGR